jgi:hypothetical protein
MVMKKQAEMTAAPAGVAATGGKSAMDVVAAMFGSATPSADQIDVVKQAREATIPAKTAAQKAVASAAHSALDAVTKMFGSATPTADAIATKYKAAVDLKASFVPASSSKGKEPAHSTGPAIDEVLLAKLEAEFAGFSTSFGKLQEELDEVNTRVSIVEKFSGMKTSGGKRKPSTRSTSAAAPVVVAATGTVSIGKADVAMNGLEQYISSTLNVKTQVVPGNKSAYSDDKTTVDGASAILAAVGGGMVGATPLERGKVQQWTSWGETGKGETLTSVFLSHLNDHLATAVYVAGYELTIADLVCYGAVKPYLPGLGGANREEVPHLTRWFNLVQHTKGLTDEKFIFSPTALNWRVAEHQ